MWEPRVEVIGWAWFAVAYLVAAMAMTAGLMALFVRLRVPPRVLTFSVAGFLSVVVALFLWLVGAPLRSAVGFGAAIVPVALIALGGLPHSPRVHSHDGDVR